jgi:hypothetical protein
VDDDPAGAEVAELAGVLLQPASVTATARLSTATRGRAIVRSKDFMSRAPLRRGRLLCRLKRKF